MNKQDLRNTNSEVDLKAVVIYIWKGRGYLVKIAFLFLLVGFVIAISIPKEYTCTIKLVPEGTKSSISGNMSNLAAMAGINIGTAGENGITLTLFPDVVKSIPFLTDLINTQIPGKDAGSERTLYNYLDKDVRQPWWGTILSSPFYLIDLIRHGHNKEKDKEINPYKLTSIQELNYLKLNERINVSLDKKTGIISAGVTLQDPVVSAIIADSLVNKLGRYVINYRTKKAKQDFDFALKMFADAKQEYYATQKRYASYMDANKNIILESVRIEQEKLKNEQSLAYSVYSSLAQQLESAKLKVQEQTPCITIIEPARVPVKKSNTSRLKIMLMCGFLGLLGGAVKVIYSNWEKIQISR
jgi:uncharacterized protein involved in exopolysaccharide biosynthesis